jgi:hypothetical protein
LGFGIYDLVFRISGFRVENLVIIVKDSWLRVHGSGFRV